MEEVAKLQQKCFYIKKKRKMKRFSFKLQVAKCYKSRRQCFLGSTSSAYVITSSLTSIVNKLQIKASLFLEEPERSAVFSFIDVHHPYRWL